MFHVKHFRGMEADYLLRNREEKIARAAHIKRNTEGTSNEISFSVLDAAKNAMEYGGRDTRPRGVSRLGSIPLFTLGKGKKPVATPSKEKEITIPSSSASSTPASYVRDESTMDSRSLAGRSLAATSDEQDHPNSASAESGGIASPQTSKASPDGPGLLLADRATSSKGQMASGTPSVVTRPAWETPLDEVARRKSARRRYKRIVVGLVSLALVGLVVSGAIVLFEGFQDQQSKRAQLAELVTEMAESDERTQVFYDYVDGLSQTPLSQMEYETLITEYSKIDINIDEEKNKLGEVKTALEMLEKEFGDPNDSEAANQALTGVNARINMLDAGDEIIQATLSSKNAYDQAEAAWQQVIDADVLVRDSAALASEASTENMQESTEKSNEALALFTQAKETLSAAQSGVGELDFEDYTRYVDLRIEAQQQALISNQAYLDRDKETLSEATNSYNALEEEAAVLAKSFPGEPSSLVEQHLNDVLGETTNAYQAEKVRALDADTFLSDYLGSSIK